MTHVERKRRRRDIAEYIQNHAGVRVIDVAAKFGLSPSYVACIVGRYEIERQLPELDGSAGRSVNVRSRVELIERQLPKLDGSAGYTAYIDALQGNKLSWVGMHKRVEIPHAKAKKRRADIFEFAATHPGQDAQSVAAACGVSRETVYAVLRLRSFQRPQGSGVRKLLRQASALMTIPVFTSGEKG